MPKIGFDARLVFGRIRGMGRFANQLLQYLYAIGLNDTVACYANSPVTTQEPHPNVRWKIFGPRNYVIWEQFTLPRQCSRDNINILICPYNTGPVFLTKACKLLLVIHDLIFMKSNIPFSPSMHQNIGRLYRRWIVPRVAKRASHVITVSEFSKQDIVSTLGIPGERVTVVPNTFSHLNGIQQAPWSEIETRYKISKPFIFHLGGEAPSKNTHRLIKAFENIHSAGINNYNLVIAGFKGRYYKSALYNLKNTEVSKKIIFTDYLSEPDLAAFYSNAQVFVLNSLYEGFGIPVLEAMYWGVPVICSNIDPLREIVGQAAVLINPYDTSGLAKALRVLLKSPNLRKELTVKGKRRVKDFHPDIGKKKFTGVINKLLNLRE